MFRLAMDILNLMDTKTDSCFSADLDFFDLII